MTKIQIQSYQEKNPSFKIDETGELLDRSRNKYEIGEVLNILIEGTSYIMRIIIAEEYKGINESLIFRKKLQIISGNGKVLKEITGYKKYILSIIKEKEYKENLIYSSKDMLEIYDFNYINDIVIESNKLLTYLQKSYIDENNIEDIYSNIKEDFTTINKLLNTIGGFEIISRKMLLFLSFFDSENNQLNIEEKKQKIEITIIFLRDFAKIFHDFEEEFSNGININENMNHIGGENDIDILVKKYIQLIKGSLDQTTHNIDIIINPNNNHYEQQKIEFF